MPSYFEKRLQTGINPIEWGGEPINAWAIDHGHPTDSVKNFFNAQNCYEIPKCMREAYAQNRPGLASFGMWGIRKDFSSLIRKVLVLPLDQCADLDFYYAGTTWKPPCGNPRGCDPLCRALAARLSVLQLAAEVARWNNKPRVCNNVFTHIDSHMPLLASITEPFHIVPVDPRYGDVVARANAQLRAEAAAARRDKDTQNSDDDSDDDSDGDSDDDSDGEQPKEKKKPPPHAQDRGAAIMPTRAEPVGPWQTVRDVPWIPDKAAPLCSGKNMEHFYSVGRPSLEYAYTVETIPDVTQLLPLALSFNNAPMSNKRAARSKIPHLTAANIDIVLRLTNILFKLFPHRCNNRECYTQFLNACLNDSSMREFTIKIIVATLLGVYKESLTKMPVVHRIETYRLFYKPVSMHMLVAALMQHNKATLLYIGKEYFREMVQRVPGFLACLKDIYAWEISDSCTFSIAETIRRRAFARMDEGIRPLTGLSDLFEGTDAIIQPQHELTRPAQTEKTVGCNVETVVAFMRDINYRTYRPGAELIFAGKEYLAPDPRPTIPKKQMDAMRAVINTFPAESPIPFDWLVYFGVPADDIRAMKDAVFNKDPVLKRTLRMLSPASYAIFYAFFCLRKEQLDYRVIPGDTYMYAMHINAIHDLFGIGVGAPISKVIGSVEVCPVCHDIKCASFQRKNAKHKNSRHGVAMLASDGTTVCAKVPKKADWQEVIRQKNMTAEEHLIALGDQNALMHSNNPRRRKMAKRVVTQKDLQLCNQTPTITLNALGRMVIYRNTLYINCYKCVNFIKMESAIIVGRDKLCEVCAHKAVTVVAKSQECDIPNCKRVVPRTGNVTRIHAYDDISEPGKRDYCVLALCSYHSGSDWLRGRGSRYMSATTIPRLSYIVTEISQAIQEARTARK